MEAKIVLADKNAKIPMRQTPGSAGYDLHSVEDVVIEPNGLACVSTGLKIALPEGYYGRIAPRSSLAVKNHIDVGAGICDSDFCGIYCVVLFNLDTKNSVHIKIGDRIAQLIIEKYHAVNFEVVGKLDSTERTGGFGSTGI